MQNKRLKNVLAAGALTGLVLATIMAFAWRDAGRANATPTEKQNTTTTTPPETQGVDALQAENEQLRSALETMQMREQQYQAQLEAANRSILQLQDAASNTVNVDHKDEDEAYGHEREEHEHEVGEYDDD
jgi:TolA-binding protein